MPLNYFKWDQLEDVPPHLLDDSDRDVHERREAHAQHIAELDAKVACNDVLLARLRSLQRALASRLSAEVARLRTSPVGEGARGRGHKLEGVTAEWQRERDELEKEHARHVTMDDLHEGFESEYVPPKPGLAPVAGSGKGQAVPCGGYSRSHGLSSLQDDLRRAERARDLPLGRRGHEEEEAVAAGASPRVRDARVLLLVSPPNAGPPPPGTRYGFRLEGYGLLLLAAPLYVQAHAVVGPAAGRLEDYCVNNQYSHRATPTAQVRCSLHSIWHLRDLELDRLSALELLVTDMFPL
ncbi:hypothetical protein BC834DRAFT_967511 [Gloeopeniophorella convolvens]|nr:hypothetical protein BC834DRAFT_967511 [Gloeopeniophorella convolvens]